MVAVINAPKVTYLNGFKPRKSSAFDKQTRQAFFNFIAFFFILF
ncbi:hypothetical protein SAMN04488505_105318 [Chitinophaga rupis]|uniref:Uncharacterized protein n=1 Tax=Chitinophaga rupis TaxID=573321 RepID=A0A1H8A4J7_9BACT|nr:hypothetical protein SAMN04488505_105318 [Chitinophaga rupis]